MRRQRKGFIVCMVVMLAMQLCVGVYAASNQNMQESKNIVEVLKKNSKEFSTLEQALEAAGLTETLKGEGQYTVFAPTNRAFEQLPKGTLEDLLKPANKAKLTDILTYHVIQGRVPASEAIKLDGQEVTMLNGKKARLKVRSGSLNINDAKVLQTDLPASNGVIHVIDTVLIPQSN